MQLETLRRIIDDSYERRSGLTPQSVTPESLLRVSVGLESADDLLEDLETALSG